MAAQHILICYVVTRLDANIRRVITGLITGERVESEQDEVIREEGDYDAGLCLVEKNTTEVPDEVEAITN